LLRNFIVGFERWVSIHDPNDDIEEGVKEKGNGMKKKRKERTKKQARRHSPPPTPR